MLKVATVEPMRALCIALWIVLAAGSSAAQSFAPGARELYQALDALRVDSHHVYYVRELNIRRDAVRISLDEGKLAFLGAYDGRLTGAVFTGRGRVLAVPRDPVEKRSLARFLGTPLLDQGFSRAYFRFTENTGEELLAQLREGSVQSAADPAFAGEWDSVVASLNPWHSLRILMDWLAATPRPYFYAGLEGDISGAFDVLVDNRRAEQVLLGQPRWVAGMQYYDVWASFRRGDAAADVTPAFAPVTYAIETSILPDRTLEGSTTLSVRATREGERVLPLELSRFLTVQSVESAERHPLAFFQNEAVNRHEIAQRGNDALLVVLPEGAHAGQELRLRITYRGNVISDAGNGVYFVGDRGSWYPHLAGASHFTPFELTFRWPRRLQLVATGKKVEEREEGEQRIGHWRSEGPIPVAGFNLGEYATETVDAGGLKVELYANRQLEQAILERFRRLMPAVPIPPSPQRPPRANEGPFASPIALPEVPPSPAAVLRQLGLEIANAMRFCERFNGPFPFDRLAVSQIPGTFGQGWPGLLYLSTLSFLTPEAQRRAGLSQRAQEHFTEIVPYHEVAHQWWGNQVGWDSYRDQWIHEGLANYIALLYADTKKAPDRALAAWLGRYRRELTTKGSGEDKSPGDLGPLMLGYRLRSSKSPDAFERVIYSKGAWVFHMLRMMLRDPAAGNPDARFAELLRGLMEAHRYRALTTEKLQRAVERVMTPAMALEGGGSMDWFFDEWVRSTGIPRYSVEFTARPQGKGFLVRGTLKQSGVPGNFLAAVPLYVARPGGKTVLLGTVVTLDERTPFQFVSSVQPRRLVIDPQLTVLCLPQ